MKRKERDAIINLTFGELDPAEAKELERSVEADPELSAEARSLASMKDALRSLRDIPECQLSVERLRDAIFREEMGSRKRSGWRWGAIFGPAVATGLAVLAFVTMQSRDAFREVGSAPDTRADSVVAESHAAVPARSAQPSVAVDPSEALPQARGPMRVARVQANPRTDGLTQSKQRPGPIVALSSRSGEDSHRSGEHLVDTVPEAPSAEPSALVSAESAGTSEPSTVVIIHSDSEDETGTRMASEVPPDQHVLIGS